MSMGPDGGRVALTPGSRAPVDESPGSRALLVQMGPSSSSRKPSTRFASRRESRSPREGGGGREGADLDAEGEERGLINRSRHCATSSSESLASFG